ncbi:MAG: O-antigen ligase family protein [Candidatus Omnitrophica bacterium]|nr:O-antigen ligase family protein [Candidatus Omnitrophota bacterium]
MKNIPFSKILIILLVCLIIGGILPFLFTRFSAKLVLFVGALFGFVCLLLIKQGRITVYDWLILFFIAIPFHDFRIMFGTFFLRSTEVFFIPFFIWAGVQITRNESGWKNLLRLETEYVILLFFYAFTVISIACSVSPFISIYRTVVLLYLILLSFIISKILKQEDKIYLIIKAMIAVSAAASIFAIFQSFVPGLQPFHPIALANLGALTIYRSGAGWQNPNYLALYLTMIFPITYVCKISSVFPEKKFFQISFVLQLLGLFSTYSRLGFISLSLTFICLLAVRGKKKLALIILIILSLLAVTTFMSMTYIYEHNPYLAVTIFRIPYLGVVKKNPLLIAGWRRDAWIANFRMFVDHPFLGVGPFMSTEMYGAYRPADQVYQAKSGLAVHNEYLSLFSERGFIGAFLFLMFLLFLTTRAIVFYKKNKSSGQGKLMLGLWASIVNFLFFSFGGATIYSVQFWVNVGIILAVYNLAKQKTLEKNS